MRRAATAPAPPLPRLAGLGPKRIEDLARLGVVDLSSLLTLRPRRYLRITPLLSLAQAQEGLVRVQGHLSKVFSRRIPGRPLSLQSAVLKTTTGSLKVLWFNRPYLRGQGGSEVVLEGILSQRPTGWQITNSLILPTTSDMSAVILKPVYPTTTGLTQAMIRRWIDAALPLRESIPDLLPPHVRKKIGCLGLHDQLPSLHHPTTEEEAWQASELLNFHELLITHLFSDRARSMRQARPGIAFSLTAHAMNALTREIPFDLTDGQTHAWSDICVDLVRSHPMARLLNGDVGSGKTAVAYLALRAAQEEGLLGIFLAPTSILAEQHVQRMRLWLPTNRDIMLVTANQKKHELAERLADPSRPPPIIVGTHAILHRIDTFTTQTRLGLVVIDEQHRFGVEQRGALLERHPIPHLLSLTATPIPRTLALTMYGDLDLSLLREKPAGRQPIVTKLVPPNRRRDLYRFVATKISHGERAYIICPAITEEGSLSEEADPRSDVSTPLVTVESEYQKLKKIFPKIAIGMIHGSMPPEEKSAVMMQFSSGKISILVATTVVEVGVDVPEATIMIIEQAERFGLATLHQLRGRIGRGSQSSSCFLAVTPGASDTRAQLLVHTDDGFTLAEHDLQLRGAGDRYGVSQSGDARDIAFSEATLPLLEKVQRAAVLIREEDPTFESIPELRRRLDARLHQIHLE